MKKRNIIISGVLGIFILIGITTIDVVRFDHKHHSYILVNKITGHMEVVDTKESVLYINNTKYKIVPYLKEISFQFIRKIDAFNTYPFTPFGELR